MSDNAIALSQKIADFIAKLDADQNNVGQQAKFIHEFFPQASESANQQLRMLSSEIDHLKSLMSRMSGQQWHQSIEKLLSDNAHETSAIRHFHQQMHDNITAQCEGLNRSSMTTIKNAAQLITSIKHTNFEKLTTEKTLALQESCKKSLRGIERVVQSFHWKNLGLAIILSMIVSMIVSLYINDVWPWEAHQEIVKQREAGKALLTSWKPLSLNHSEMINQNA